MIPAQLRNSEFRFVLLGEWDSWKNKETNEETKFVPETYEEIKKEKSWNPLGKTPFEKNWQNEGHPYNDAKLVQHIKKLNYGIIGGYGRLRILDIDDIGIGEIFKDKLNTFTVETGGGGKHFYFLSDYDTNHVLVNELGELRAKNYQVVCPPCRHPSGNYYKVIKDIPIREISPEELKEIIQPFLREKLDFEFKERPKDTSGSGLEYRRVLALIREGKSKEDIFNEMTKYTKWATHGLKFPQYREQTYNNALKFHEENSIIKTEEKNFELIWEGDLQNYEIKEKEWLIDKLIPSRAVCVLTGKRGTMKTFVALQMAYAIGSGDNFLGKFESEQGNVLYLDKENGLNIMKKRIEMIRKGLELKENVKVGFICFSQLKIDKNVDIWAIEEEIKKNDIHLLIVDTYRRAISFDENDAGAVSKLFVDVLRPMVEKNNLSILLIHHNRKGVQGEKRDEMDEIRGSSDLANYADIILNMERKKGTLILKQLKNRNAMEELPVEINVVFNESSLKMDYKGEYKKMSKIEKCVEDLCIWIETGYINQFSTKQGKDIAFKKGHKESTFKNALIQMQDSDLIKNIEFGVYDVTNKLRRIG